MLSTHKTLLLASLACSLPLLLAAQTAAKPAVRQAPARPSAPPSAAQPLNPQEQAAQIVDRFTFGPTPGMVQAVQAEGWQHWFAQQLHPETLPDPALDARLLDYPALALPPAALAERFPDAQALRRIETGKASMPTDPRLAAVYRVLLARYQARQQARATPADKTGPAPATPNSASAPTNAQAAPNPNTLPDLSPIKPGSANDSDGAKQQAKRVEQARAAALAPPILALPPAQRLPAILALPMPDTFALTANLREPARSQLLQGVSPDDRELLAILAAGHSALDNELQQAKILRAVLSTRQLQEVMTDFWFNHFNIDLRKRGDEAQYAPAYERDAIRAHALGRFSDLLLATARSPAMLLYLDNATSIGPDSPAALRAQGLKNGPQKTGLNENYGREVMELHTLGVEGGYTQADVTALANILTGWTVQQPQQGGGFAFLPQRHQPGSKQWLGHIVREHGEQEGIDALRYLAAQPATAQHICYQLAQRFVADSPSPALVRRMVAAWQASDGNIAQVLTAMVNAPEFLARANFHNQVKTPLQFVASAARATQLDPTHPAALVQTLRAMGQPLYQCQPPTGYTNVGASWMSSAALLDRLNFALALGEGRLGGMQPNLARLAGSPLMPASQPASFQPAPLPAAQQQSLAAIEHALLPVPLTPQTASVIQAQLVQLAHQGSVDPDTYQRRIVALLLGSPEFQLQ